MIGKELPSQPTDTLVQEIMGAFLYASYLDSLNKPQPSKEEALARRRGAVALRMMKLT